MLIVLNPFQNQVSKGSKTSALGGSLSAYSPHAPTNFGGFKEGDIKLFHVDSPKTIITKSPETRPDIPKGNEKVFQPSICFCFCC